MKKNANVIDLLALVETLSPKDQKIFAKKVMNMMSRPSTSNESKSFSCNEMVSNHLEQEKPNCPHCQAKSGLGYIVKRGYKNGVQRFGCKACGHYFFATTGTVFEKTRKNSDTWMKFIELTISGASLKQCAEECHIAYQTAFTWRHKVLNTFRVQQDAITMSGKIELDEMLIPISYKGNHVQGESFLERKINKDNTNNDMPRKSFQRGSDNKSLSSKNKACVFCMVKDGNKGFYATVPGVGFMNPSMLDRTVAKHVDKDDTLLLADQYKVTANYLDSNDYKYMILASNTSTNVSEHKVEVRDGHHLQHVNAMHMHLRKFLSKYCGVSTKYLENYISPYIWLKNVAACRQKKHTKKVSISRMATSDCYISRKELEALPAVPKCD